MKIGALVDSLKLPLEEGIERAATLGLDGIQMHVAVGECPVWERTDEEIVRLREKCRSLGLEISATCGDLGGHGFERREENATRIPQMRRVVDVTDALGCKVVTTHIGVIPSDRDCPQYEVMRAALAEIGDYAGGKGLCLAIETGPEPARILRRFIEDTGSDAVKVNLDPANMIMVLNEDPAESAALLGPYIVHTHAKDGVHYRKCDPMKVYHAFAEGGFDKLLEETGQLFEETPLGQGQVKWPAYLAALRGAGFDGFLTIERETGGNPAADIAAAVSFLRQALAES